MSKLKTRLDGLSPDTLKSIRRGVEKESLRAQTTGHLALTPHPRPLGSALTHPHVTTDFSEAQLELITGVHGSIDACVKELTEIHQFVCRSIDKEVLWVSSMPCMLPTDETIPIGMYGRSNVGRAKSVYRMGLGHRYGRRMQMISGIHYNWSLPGLSTSDYFGLIRNFRRHSFLLLYLFGASPAVCSSFVEGRSHELQPLNQHGLHMPYGTSLRMGRLGYQSDAQGSLAVSYNSLESYAASLQEALTRPYPPYVAIGIRNLGGDYNQLATSLLQIENEFYGTIRPKRIINSGERPLHALRERGVEYVEVRCMDLNPFLPVGIDASTMRFIDMLLLHCLLKDSPPDTLLEIAALSRNQHLVAAHGRNPSLVLDRGGKDVSLTAWASEVLDEISEIAAALDRAHGGNAYAETLTAANAAVNDANQVPSARVLSSMINQYDGSHVRFTMTEALKTKSELLNLPFTEQQESMFCEMSKQSVERQAAIEIADTVPFETYRENYLAASSLGE
ncbi:MAG: glutamate--cysteine ligase [Rhodocyclaceae bacterium]|nr:glutamate--cysteine ligase [Rhodocyclaceae bacterium]